MADIMTPNPLNNQTATLRDGRKLDVNSPEVVAYMKQYPAVSMDAALGSVANMLNARAAGQQTPATPASAGSPGFGGGLAPGQKTPTYAPIPAPQGPTGAGVGPTGALNAPTGPGGDVSNPQYGSNSAFMNAYSQIMGKAQKNQELQDQRNKLIASLYDHTLTPEEMRTLSPTQQQAIQNGDRNLIEWQITSINDIIKGRADDTKTALDYMLQGYQADQAAAKQAQAEADKKRDDARAVILDVMNKYGSDQLAQAGITQADIQNVLDTGQISADFALKLSKIQNLAAQKIDATANSPLTYKQALDMAAKSPNPAAAWDILKTQIGQSTPTEVSPSGAGNRADRNNNPLNIKVGGATQKWVDNGSATLDPNPASDGGKFLKFNDPKQGLEAAKELLQSKVYASLTLDAAMKKWSGNGYGAEVCPSIDPKKKISDLTSQELDELVNDMSVREGYTGGSAKLSNPFAAGTSEGNMVTGPINSSDPGYSTKKVVGGYTQETVDQLALEYAETGKMPSLGLGAAADIKARRDAVANRAANLAALAGTDLPTLQAAYAANKSALSKLTYYGAQVGQFEKTASLNFDVALDKMNQVDSSGSPIWNKYAQAVKTGYFGDPDVAAFKTALTTFSKEYAKLMSGSVSASGATVSSQKDAEEMINAAMTKGQIMAISDVIKKDMANRMKAIDQTTKGLDNGLVSFYDAIYGRTDKPAGGTDNSDPMGIL